MILPAAKKATITYSIPEITCKTKPDDITFQIFTNNVPT